jgi:phosphopantothenoylcysteine decarboxylase / phosphopantothenate---cysteine ligase
MKILITAGPTREKIDTVRFISNRSTGKMGYALAHSALKADHEVTLISGPVALVVEEGIELVSIESAAEMACEVRKYANFADIIIMSAAVADYRPVNPIDGKLKKSDGNLIIELERTEDILASLGQNNPNNVCLVGFAAETSHLLENALEKLKNKNLDWIIANDVSMPDRGFGADDNAVIMIARNGEKIVIPLQDKRVLADRILSEIFKRLKS